MSRQQVSILEVGPRDGLQNEKTIIGTDAKLELIERAIAAGIRRIEVTSFVHPKRVPQMADAEDVVAGLPDHRDVQYIGLVLNKRGYLRALETRAAGRRGVDQVGCVVVASETFSEKNQGQTIEEAVEVSSDVIRLARRDGLSGQVTVSAAFGCPFEGEVPQGRVIDLCRRLAEAEPEEICIADTVGVAVPQQVSDLMGALKDALPGMPLRIHLHNTRNTAVANAWAAYQEGVKTIDASMGGLGGCPFAPAATGNVATEDIVYMFDRSGVETGVDLEALVGDTAWLQDIMGRKLDSMLSQAGGFPGAPATAGETV